MALEFKKIQPIRFGDFEAVPKMTTSSRMRLQKIKFMTKEDMKEAREVLSECFGSKADEVLDFMTENMTALDMQRLQAYLIGGESMLENVDAVIRDAMKPENVRKEVE